MKIALIITSGSDLGGAQIHIKDLYQVLSSQFEVELIVGSEGSFTNLLKALNINYTVIDMSREISPWKDYKSYLAIKKHLKSSSPNIVSAHSSKAGVLARLACRANSIPCVFTAHGWAFTGGKKGYFKYFYEYVEKLMARFTAKIINVSAYDMRLALDKNIGNSDLHCVIHNGIDDKIKSAGTAPPKKNVRKFLMVARFCSAKNHKLLIEAFSQLKSKSDWSLEFVGGGNCTEEKQLSNKYGLDKKVTFHGEQDNPQEYIEGCDCLILCSNWEGFPLVILEGMMNSKPIMTSYVGGANEAVQIGDCGYVITNSVPNWTKALEDILVDDDAFKLGVNGREAFEEFFIRDVMVHKYLDVFKGVLNE